MFNDTPAQNINRLLGVTKEGRKFNDALNTFFLRLFGLVWCHLKASSLLLTNKQTNKNT